jgi:hypothetical protein
MAGRAVSVREIFDQAQELATPGERAAYLEEACAGRPEVRREVEALLRALDRAGDFLARPAVAVTVAPLGTEVRQPAAANEGLDFLEPSTKPGALGRFLHYEVQEVLGKGGFGVVLIHVPRNAVSLDRLLASPID